MLLFFVKSKCGGFFRFGLLFAGLCGFDFLDNLFWLFNSSSLYPFLWFLLLQFLFNLFLHSLLFLLIPILLSTFNPLNPLNLLPTLLSLLFLLLTLLLLRTRKGNLTLHLIIILKNIANKLTISNIKIALLDPNGSDEPLPTVFVTLLILLYLSVCLLYIRQPFHDPPGPERSAKDIDARIGGYFQPYPRQFLSIHATQNNDIFIFINRIIIASIFII